MAKIQPGDVISHTEMCLEEMVSLQRGMNFRLKNSCSVILMSLRKGALTLIELKTTEKY